MVFTFIDLVGMGLDTVQGDEDLTGRASYNLMLIGSSQIAWWMADLWFGLDASGFDRACKLSAFYL